MLAFRVMIVGASIGFIRIRRVMARFRPIRANPDFARQIALAETIMRDDREVLRALAK